MGTQGGADQEKVKEWITSMISDLSHLSPLSSTWSICRVPEKIRSVKDEAYDPQLISIGPIHYGEQRLRSMENHKQYYLLSLLERTPDVVLSLEECCYTILGLDEKVRASYADSIEPDKIKLATILLQDAGFMLELFLRCYDTDSCVQDDPVFTTSWMNIALKRDLALFENQIPFFVLESLYKLVFPRGVAGVVSPYELALGFYKSTLNIDDETYRRKCDFKGSHLLHLLYNCYLPLSPETGKRNKGETLEFIHNATSLRYAGISFERSGSNNLFDMKFRDGVFYIPTLCVHDSTDSLFRNFIAIEQCQQNTPHYIISYCMVLDRLIDTAKDVEILVEKRIIENDLGGESDVLGVVNDLCKQVVLNEFYFVELCDQVNVYAKATYHRTMADLKRNYFNTPWSYCSFGAAVILLSLTTLQTVYSVLSYYKS